jgi:hypothetical protein
MNIHQHPPYQTANHAKNAPKNKQSVTMSGYVSTDDQVMAMKDLAAAMEMVAILAEGENYRNDAEIFAPQMAPLMRVFAGFTRSYCTNLPYAHGITATFDG